MEAAQSVAGADRRTARLKPGVQPSPGKPVIIMLSGLPGTGKSYLSRKLAERLPFMIVESDAVRKELFPRPSYSARESASVFGVVHYIIRDLLQNNISVIFDATNLEEKHRETIYRIAERTRTKVILVNLEAPPEIVKQRLESRTQKRDTIDYSDATWTVYQRMKKTVDKISRPDYTVNTAEDITPVIEEIIREANR
jgi:predicted kinase